MSLPFRRSIAPAVLLILAVAQPAAAHAELVSADPGPDAVVTTVPPELEATFSQNLDPSRGSIEVRDASNARVALGGPVAGQVRAMRADLPALANGRYTVRWTSFSSEDQELARGTYTFTVRLASPSPSPTPTPTPTPTVAATTAPASPSPTVPASSTPTASPSPTPTATSSATAPPSVGPTPTPAPTPAPTDTTGTAVLLPVLVALAVVAIVGLMLVRGRRR